VAEEVLQVETESGTMPTFVAHPEDGGPFPAVILYMDALGVRDQLRDLTRQVAAEGYYAVAPDFYHHFGEGIVFDGAKIGDPSTGEMERMFATMQQLSDEMAMADTRAVLDRLEGESLVSSGPKGAVGFCMGGRLVVRAMAAFPGEFVAGSALHPSFIVGEGPDSPHLDLHKVRGELYVGLGGADDFQPPAAFGPAQAELERLGIPHEVEVHEAAAHGFMIPGSPIFQDEASTRCWERTFELFGRTLQGAPVAAD
jgi:carboxymethylenebutenolidase